MEQYIVSNCHKKCNLHGMVPNCQLVCRRSYALTQAELKMRPRSATARDPTNSCVPTCELLRRHSSTTNTRMLPSVPTTKTIHSTTTLTYVNQPTPENHVEVAQLVVVPVEFQSLVSSGPFSFVNDTGLVKFILAKSVHEVVGCVSAVNECFVAYFDKNDEFAEICIISSHRAFSSSCALSHSHSGPMVSCPL